MNIVKLSIGLKECKPGYTLDAYQKCILDLVLSSSIGRLVAKELIEMIRDYWQETEVWRPKRLIAYGSHLNVHKTKFSTDMFGHLFDFATDSGTLYCPTINDEWHQFYTRDLVNAAVPATTEKCLECQGALCYSTQPLRVILTPFPVTEYKVANPPAFIAGRTMAGGRIAGVVGYQPVIHIMLSDARQSVLQYCIYEESMCDLLNGDWMKFPKDIRCLLKRCHPTLVRQFNAHLLKCLRSDLSKINPIS
jgi:hypothetical protein